MARVVSGGAARPISRQGGTPYISPISRLYLAYVSPYISAYRGEAARGGARDACVRGERLEGGRVGAAARDAP